MQTYVERQQHTVLTYAYLRCNKNSRSDLSTLVALQSESLISTPSVPSLVSSTQDRHRTTARWPNYLSSCLVIPASFSMTPRSHASGAYREYSVIWVRNSDSVRDGAKVRVTSVVLVTAKVRFRDLTRRRRPRHRRPRRILPVGAIISVGCTDENSTISGRHTGTNSIISAPIETITPKH